MANRFHPLFWSLCVLGCLLALALAWLPVPVSIAHFIIEDMFYYLQAARHLNAGDVASLDGLHATNGFHPLWMAVSRCVEGLSRGDGSLPVHLELTLCALAFALTGGVLFLCLRKTIAVSLALPLTALFLFNYRMMTIPLGGLESGVAGLSVGLLTLFLLTHRPEWRTAIPAGLLLGLACLSRLDALLLTGIVLAWWSLSPFLRDGGMVKNESGFFIQRSEEEEAKQTGNFSIPGGRLISLVCSGALAGVVCLLVLMPWFVFSWRTSQTLLPNSRVAIESWSGYQWNSAAGLVGNLVSLTKSRVGASIEPLNDLGTLLGVWPVASPEVGGLRYLGALVTLAGLVVLLVIVWKGHHSAGILPMAWIPVYVVAHIGYYVFFGHIAIRYFYPTFLPAIVWLGACAGGWIHTARDPGRALRWGTWVVVFLICGTTLAGIGSFQKGQATGRFHPLHLGLYSGLAPWLGVNTPFDAHIGSFNAGILSYYSGRQVVNLDGVMNDSVIPALQTRTLANYLDQHGISYLADAEEEITKFMGRFGGDLDWKKHWETVLSLPAAYRGGTMRANLVVMKRK